MSLKSSLMQQIRKAVQLATDLCDLFEHEPLSSLVSMLAEDLMTVSEAHHRWRSLDIGQTVTLMGDLGSLLSRLIPTGKDPEDRRLQLIKGYLERLKEIKAGQ
jgi:hypothetical protein